MPLPLTGADLAAYNNLPAIPPSEPLGALLNSIPGSVASPARADVLISGVDLLAGPRTLTIPAVAVGVYALKIRMILDLDGTTGGDGVTLAALTSEGQVDRQGRSLALGPASVAAIQFLWPGSSPAPFDYAFIGQNGRVVVESEAEIEVTTVTDIGVRATVTGAPTQADLLDGSSIVLIPLSV